MSVPEATELQQGLDDRLLQRFLSLLDRVAVPAAVVTVLGTQTGAQCDHCQ